MKVVFFSTAGNNAGGAVKCLIEMMDYFIDKGVECLVIMKSDGNLEEYFKERNIRYKVIKSYDWLLPICKLRGTKNRIIWIIKSCINCIAEKKVYRLLKKERPDIYHLNVIYNGLGAKSAKKLNIPVVWHLREFAEVNEFTPFFVNRKKAFSLIEKADKIICVSDCLLEYYAKWLPREKLYRIYDGINMPEIPIFKRKLKKEITITLAGGARVKGHFDIVRALAILKNSGLHDITLQIAGKFYEKDYLESIKAEADKLCVKDNIKYVGQLENLDKIWQKTDIAVVCSRFESFGRTAIEAMANAVPLVCAKTSGSYEITNNGKFCELYDVGNAEMLADKIRYIIDNYDYAAERSLDIAGIVCERYPIINSSMGLYEIFKGLVNI